MEPIYAGLQVGYSVPKARAEGVSCGTVIVEFVVEFVVEFTLRVPRRIGPRNRSKAPRGHPLVRVCVCPLVVGIIPASFRVVIGCNGTQRLVYGRGSSLGGPTLRELPPAPSPPGSTGDPKRPPRTHDPPRCRR